MLMRVGSPEKDVGIKLTDTSWRLSTASGMAMAAERKKKRWRKNFFNALPFNYYSSAGVTLYLF